ncbi:MAG: hypothetical protein R2940_04410 [Syntrophotaleaceae bacterium]
MGIAVAIIYLPIFLVCTIVSIVMGIKIFDFKSPFAKTSILALFQLFLVLLGMIIPVIICIFAMRIIQVSSNQGGYKLIENLAISLFGPLSIGVSFFLFSFMFNDKVKAILRYFSTGAMFSVPLLPLVAFMYFLV